MRGTGNRGMSTEGLVRYAAEIMEVRKTAIVVKQNPEARRIWKDGQCITVFAKVGAKGSKNAGAADWLGALRGGQTVAFESKAVEKVRATKRVRGCPVFDANDETHFPTHQKQFLEDWAQMGALSFLLLHFPNEHRLTPDNTMFGRWFLIPWHVVKNRSVRQFRPTDADLQHFEAPLEFLDVARRVGTIRGGAEISREVARPLVADHGGR